MAGKHYQDIFGTYRSPAQCGLRVLGFFHTHANYVLLYVVLARPASGFHVLHREEGPLGESLESKDAEQH